MVESTATIAEVKVVQTILWLEDVQLDGESHTLEGTKAPARELLKITKDFDLHPIVRERVKEDNGTFKSKEFLKAAVMTNDEF